MRRILFVLFITTLIFADISQTISYQGKLTDMLGVAINDTVEMKFRIFNDATTGDSLWGETHNDVPVIHGIFMVELGSINPIDLPFDTTYWLAIIVNDNPLTPRAKLTSSPYALHAATADSISGGGGVILPGGSDGQIQFNDSSGTGVTFGGAFDFYWDDANNNLGLGTTPDELAKFFIHAAGMDQGVIIDSSNSLGLGIAYPGNIGIIVQKAEVVGVQIDSAGADGIYINSPGENGIVIDSVGSDGAVIRNSNSNGILIKNSNEAGIIVDSAGIFGIGISNPGNTGIVIQSPAVNGIQIDSAGADGISIGTPIENGIVINSAGIDGVVIQSPLSNGIVIENPNEGGIIIDSAGFFGIGISSSGNTGIVIQNPAVNGVQIDSAGENGIYITNSTSEGIRIISSGNNGIRIDTTGGNGIYVRESGSNGIMVYAATDDGMYIHSPLGNGINVYNAGDDGLYVSECVTDGVHVQNTGEYGLHVSTPGTDGLKISHAGAEGVDIFVTEDDGVHIADAGGHGLFISGASYDGVHVASASGYAGYFGGQIYATTANAGIKSFLIDHPSDPEHKLLRHYSIESPEVLLIYRGKVILDEAGEMEVKMPDYFINLTDEDGATVQLTPIGRPFLTGYDWNAENATITIYGEPNREVSYQVSAERDDPVKQMLAGPLEENKNDSKYCPDGKLLIPEAYGFPKEMNKIYQEDNK